MATCDWRWDSDVLRYDVTRFFSFSPKNAQVTVQRHYELISAKVKLHSLVYSVYRHHPLPLSPRKKVKESFNFAASVLVHGAIFLDVNVFRFILCLEYLY